MEAESCSKKLETSSMNVYAGVITGYTATDALGAIEVIYITDEYSTPKIKRGIICEGNKDLFMAHTDVSEFGKQVLSALDILDNAVIKARFDLQAAIAFRKLFQINFGKAFEIEIPELKPEAVKVDEDGGPECHVEQEVKELDPIEDDNHDDANDETVTDVVAKESEIEETALETTNQEEPEAE